MGGNINTANYFSLVCENMGEATCASIDNLYFTTNGSITTINKKA